jgi:hypothetical protein
MTARATAPAKRWQIRVLLIVSFLAVTVGTIANGFYGQHWFFNADNVVDALPLALLFLVAAGVIAGQDRWPAGRTWLTVGAWLLAAAGALAVVLQVQIAMVDDNGSGILDAQPWSFVRGLAGAFADVIGFASLAIGLWLSRPSGWGAIRPAVIIGIAAVIAIAAAGPVAALGIGPIVVLDPIVILGQAPIVLELVASGALAVAAMRAAPQARPVPELLIALGSACTTIAHGIGWWLFYLEPPFETFALLAAAAGAGLLVLAAGFWSATLFWPMANESLAATEGVDGHAGWPQDSCD